MTIRRFAMMNIAILTLALFLLLCAVLHFERVRSEEPSELLQNVSLSSPDRDVLVRLIPGETDQDLWYCFLPAGIPLDKLTLDIPARMNVIIDESVYTAGDTVSAPQNTELPLHISYRNRTILSAGIIFMQAEHTPSLFLTVLGDDSFEKVREDLSKKTTASVLYRSVTPDGKTDISGQCLLGGRGNITWKKVETKKPYRLSLTNDVSFFGMRSASKWTLLANYYDDTFLRNHIALETARRLDCEDTPEDRFVNLYVDGRYQGLYQMTQKPDMDGGSIQTSRGENYQLEFNTEGWVNEGAMTYTSSLKLISLNYPQAVSAAQWADLKDSIDRAEASFLAADDFYRDHIDETSFVKQFLIHESYLNKDVDFSSQFILRKGRDPLWYAGPLWDFDRSFGAEELKLSYNGTELQVMWIEGMTRGGSVDSGWYKALYEIPAFKNALKTYYRSVFSDVYSDMTELVPALEQELRASIAMDYARYGMDISDHHTSCERLRQWMSDRKDFLDAFWADEENYLRITFLTARDEDNWHDMIYYCLPGTPFKNFPTGNGIIGWQDADGQKIHPDTPLMSNMVLHPVYEQRTD